MIDQTFRNHIGNDSGYHNLPHCLLPQRSYFDHLSFICFQDDRLNAWISPTNRLSPLITRCYFFLNNRHWPASESTIITINFYGLFDTLAVKDSQGSLLVFLSSQRALSIVPVADIFTSKVSSREVELFTFSRAVPLKSLSKLQNRHSTTFLKRSLGMQSQTIKWIRTLGSTQVTAIIL